ncbi:MAG TPA: quinol:electron acceptor oxidoreductase subunit ActD [Chloroflexota bacterium]|nr:quinol:electron acceptor oxidoreductase subunit ActD [Chloroflexota bacterium]
MADETGAVLGLFERPDDVAAALDRLRAAGFTGHDLAVLTDSPYPEGAFGEEPVRHRLYVFPFVGAACGFAVGLLLTIATQFSFPLVTGGKPILSIPPMINVLYEGTMLGALIFTFLGALFESRLPDFRPTPYDPRITEGYLGVLVRRTAGHADEARAALRAAGAFDVVPPPSAREEAPRALAAQR